MARPRKDQVEPLASERIKNALWRLLADHDLKDITIGMITNEARCNRGTFYYHFESIDALLYAIIEEELLRTPGLPLDLFLLFCDEGEEKAESCAMLERSRRFGLIMQRAGHEYIGHKVKAVVVGLWRAILCDGGDCLTEETRVLIEFSVSGIIGSIDYLYREGLLEGDEALGYLTNIVRNTSCYLMQRIGEAQNLEPRELETRIRMINLLMRSGETSLADVRIAAH